MISSVILCKAQNQKQHVTIKQKKYESKKQRISAGFKKAANDSVVQRRDLYLSGRSTAVVLPKIQN
jgi:hypothetical protein